MSNHGISVESGGEVIGLAENPVIRESRATGRED
jgi:hypothetical protein